MREPLRVRDTPQTGQVPAGSRAGGKWWFYTWGAGVFLLALAARLWRVTEQSVWLDEFFSYNYLDAPSLYECILRQRPENWEMVPLYYAAQYYWAQLVPGSIAWVRLLSIFPSAVAVALAALLTWRYLGMVAGCVTGCWLALSPFHVFYGQGIRPYAWLYLLGLLSWWTLYRWQASGMRRWLLVSLTLNAAMAWTHLLTPLMFAAQGCWLWGARRFRLDRALLSWGVVHGMIILTLVPWVMTIRPAPDPPNQAPPPLGSLATILLDQGAAASESFLGKTLFADNEPVRWTLKVPPRFDLQLAGGYAGLVSATRQPLELALARLVLLGLVLAVAAGCLRRGKHSEDTATGRPDPLWLWLTAALVPLVLLYAMALAWKPHVFQVRYLCFALVFLPGAIMGGVNRMVPRAAPFFGMVAVMLVAAFYAGYHAVPVRHDYLGVARLLREPACQDMPVITPDWNLARVLLCNDRALTSRVIRPEPEQFENAVSAALAGGKPFALLFEGDLSESIRRGTEYSLIQREVPFRRIIFSGLQNLYVYLVTPGA